NRRDATAPAASGSPAIVPGNLEESELYQRITAEDASERMPPAESGKSLSTAEIARLRTWIEEGAEYQGHWAFVPPTRPGLPAVQERRVCPHPTPPFGGAPPGARGPLAKCGSRQGHADPPAQPRPDGPAADAPGGRRLRRRPPGRCLRPAGRPPARFAALRR